MSETPPSVARHDSAPSSIQRLVLKNTLFLTLAQIVGVPLSILMNAMMARYLGATAVGTIYLVSTFNAFGFLAVDWGQSGALTALVARDRSRAGPLLGTSLAWRGATSGVVYVLLVLLCRFLGYDSNVQIVLTLVFAGYLLSALSNACQYAILGFERTDVAAYRQVLEQIAALLIVGPILFLGGTLYPTMVGHAAAVLVTLVYTWRALKSTGVGRLSVDAATLRTLLRDGTPFVFFSLAMVLQPYVDAVFLSKLASVEVVGWHAAARRLVGLLIFPASALIGALYPTLCRLFVTDKNAFLGTTSGALRGTSLLVIPVALGTALYPDIGISIYGHQSFAPAEDNLRVLSLYLFLMYFTMPLGSCLLAAGKQRPWAIVQSVCVAMSVVLDPILVPWFQKRTGNGGLGVCWAAVASEVLVIAFGVVLAPKGLFDRRFWRSLFLAALAGGAMAGVAHTLRAFNPFLAAPVAVAAYAGVLWITGGIDPTFIAMIRGFLARKLARFR